VPIGTPIPTKLFLFFFLFGCRHKERLKVKTDGSTRLTYTGLSGELENLKIEMRLIVESFECVMGE
jgi:hypothetical protein